jgi:uncharacterized repeat protein (TIGR03803 family)
LYASDGNLYGTCYDGGSFASCTIFRLNPSTCVYTDVVSFDITHGDYPRSGVIEAPNGKLYGAASSGGAYSAGVIYSYDLSTGAYADVFDLSSLTGAIPWGNPILHTNGKLYGMTTMGGATGHGVIYSFDISTNVYTDVHDFNSANGSAPYGSLIQLINGKLYGMTSAGGTNNKGVIFSYDPVQDVYTKLFDFNQAIGSVPKGSLMQASNGFLYGMTSEGGLNNSGTIFKYNVAAASFTSLYSFNSVDGKTPLGSLMQSGGVLCGTTSLGGASSAGTMFNFNLSSNVYTNVLSFNGANGSNPNGGFIQVITTGIDQNPFNNENLSVFPNPVADELHIIWKSNQPQKATISLNDISGRTVYSSFENNIVEDSKIINLTGISPGTYILEINTDKEKMVKKIVKN